MTKCYTPKPVKILSKAERKRLAEIEECCKRARARRSNPLAVKEAAATFYAGYFAMLRQDRNITPSLDDNTPNPSATAQKGLMALKVKLNSMDKETREREERAIKEAETRNKSVAPAYNKGGYQLISKDSLHTIGRKV
jgi:acyl-homoserine lactone acylase PvdQ